MTHRTHESAILNNYSFIIVKITNQNRSKKEMCKVESGTGRIPNVKLSCPQGHVTLPASVCGDTFIEYYRQPRKLTSVFTEASLSRCD